MKGRGRSRSLRGIAATLSAAIAVVVFAALGGAGLAQSAIALAQKQDGHGAQHQDGQKIVVCHKQRRAISISVNAWPAHQRHGDTQGACSQQAAAKTNKGKKQTSDETSAKSKQKKTKKGSGTSKWAKQKMRAGATR